LIVPLSAEAQKSAQALRSLAAQDYPDFELILAARNGDSVSVALPSAVKVAMAPESDISLLQLGMQSARQRSEIFAFAQPDGLVSPFWLRALVEPLGHADVGASTGFRFYAPDPPAFWPLMRSVWNGLIAGRLGPAGHDFVWSGAMAITKASFTQARVGERWAAENHKDFVLSRAVLDIGKQVAFAPAAMVAYADRPTAREFFRQARREMTVARQYLPRPWWAALVAHVVYCGAMLAAVVAIANGSGSAEWALVVQFGLGMLKGANRATLAKAQLPQLKTWFDRYSWTHTFWTPIATWVWLCVLIASLFPSRKKK